MTIRLMSPTTLITVILVALTGCGGGNPIKANDRASITSVSVDPTVKVAGEPAVIGSEAGLAILFGGAGGAAGAGSSNPKTFGEFMHASGIDIGQIVRGQFTEQLKANAFFGPRLSQNGEYRFVLEVRMYGINKTNTFSSNWVANLGIHYQLLAPSGKVVAQDSAVAPPFSDRRTFTAEEMKANPEILKKAFEELAATLTAKLVPKDG